MRPFAAFIKKEFTENIRTLKLFILVGIFIVLGIVSPILAKLTPEIMEAALPEFDMSYDTSAYDAWIQFFGNVAQLGLISFAIVYAGIMAGEFSKGTLINILTKGLKRSTVLWAKFTTVSAIWMLCYFASFVMCLGVTAFIWEPSEMHNAFLAFAAPWLFGEFVISLLFFGGILFKSFIGSLLSAGAVVAFLSLLNISPVIVKYNPATLIGSNISVLMGAMSMDDFLPALIICTVLLTVVMVSAHLLFNKKQI